MIITVEINFLCDLGDERIVDAIVEVEKSDHTSAYSSTLKRFEIDSEKLDERVERFIKKFIRVSSIEELALQQFLENEKWGELEKLN